MRLSPTSRKQQGFSLVELMIAGLISTILSMIVIQIMSSSTAKSAQSDGAAQSQETGRFALSWLMTEVRRAGYTADLEEERIAPFANLCDNDSGFPPADNGDCTFDSDDPTVSDRIAVRRQFSSASGNVGDQQDCTGADVSAQLNEGDVIVDVYWVEASFMEGTSTDEDELNADSHDDELKCVSYSESTHQVLNAAQVIATGVEGLQALYAESPTGTAQDVTRYVGANEVQFGVTAEEMRSVMAIRVALLTRSFAFNALPRATRSYILLDANPYTFTDRINRQIMVTTAFSSNY